MASISYQTIRSSNQAREADIQRSESRKKNLLLLVMHYLSEEGYVDSATSLSQETNLDFHKYEVCDNVDLETILMEYESYYYVKFQKYPKITKLFNGNSRMPLKSKDGRKGAASFTKRTALPSIVSNHAMRSDCININISTQKQHDERCAKETTTVNGIPSQDALPTRLQSSSQPQGAKSSCSLSAQGHRVVTTNPNNSGSQRNTSSRHVIDMRAVLQRELKLGIEESQHVAEPQERILKPLGGYAGFSGEWRELAMTISREIYLENPEVRWDDIVGLDAAKRLVKEAVVYPIKYPQLFTGILSPWKGLLLYGPPGTGKTLLAKAVATECNTTFFNISASTIVSKWRGDSEKLVRVLFELARFHAPSTIFLDELDSLMSQRGSLAGCAGDSGPSPGASTTLGEHEGSRRMKTELLVQMDGLAKSEDLVFLLAASNIPWELDHAMLRRLEKRIHVDLPNEAARLRMFQTFLPMHIGTKSSDGLQLTCSIDYSLVAQLTEGYSGSDIRLVCKEAAMRVVRKIFNVLENSAGNGSALPETQIRLDTVTTNDVVEAISSTKPSATQLAKKYKEWQRYYGSS